MLSEYGRLLQGDPHYAGRAARVSALSRDIAQVMGAESEGLAAALRSAARRQAPAPARVARSEEHTSELQSQSNLVCRLLLEKKKIVICGSIPLALVAVCRRLPPRASSDP